MPVNRHYNAQAFTPDVKWQHFHPGEKKKKKKPTPLFSRPTAMKFDHIKTPNHSSMTKKSVKYKIWHAKYIWMPQVTVKIDILKTQAEKSADITRIQKQNKHSLGLAD